MKIRATSARKKKGGGADGRDWAHVTPNQDFGGFEGDFDGCRARRTVEVEVLPSSGPAGAPDSLGPSAEGEAGGVSGANAFSTGSAMMNGAENIVSGFSPSNVIPRRGVDAGRVRTNASAKCSRSCRDSSDGRIERRKEVKFCSLHGDRIVHGTVIALGGTNVRP
jgi:hypothetical protein